MCVWCGMGLLVQGGKKESKLTSEEKGVILNKSWLWWFFQKISSLIMPPLGYPWLWLQSTLHRDAQVCRYSPFTYIFALQVPIGLFSQAMAGAAVLPLTQHRAQHRVFSAQRKCSTKQMANGFLLTVLAPRKGCTLTDLLPNMDLVNDFEKEMITSKCCSNTQTSSQMPTGGISAYS